MQQDDLLKRLVDAACAVHRVSDRIPADEPLVRFLKESSLKATESCVVFFCAPGEYNVKKVHGDIEALCSYFIIARQQNWVDFRNFNTLLSEYRALKDEFEKIFQERAQKESSQREKTERRAAPKPKSNLTGRQERALSFIKGKVGEEVSLKDLRALFPDIASRTIQRDVQSLLEAGFIEKRGTTHNTTYHFI